MFFTADALVAHAIGDYALQNDWMASKKVKSTVAALVHALTYSLPFLFLTLSWKALAVIAGTHFLIDRFRLARYLVWAKNLCAPQATPQDTDRRVTRYVSRGLIRVGQRYTTPGLDGVYLVERVEPYQGQDELTLVPADVWRQPWAKCQKTGFPPGRPDWLTTWLLIIVDNLLHVCINAAALAWL